MYFDKKWVCAALLLLSVVLVVRWNDMRTSLRTSQVEAFHDDGEIRDEFIKELQDASKKMSELVDMLAVSYNEHRTQKEATPTPTPTPVPGGGASSEDADDEESPDDEPEDNLEDTPEDNPDSKPIESFDNAKDYTGYMLL